ncbi:MAG: hypothetical protein EA384_03485 [Spirochaetaceae bacterium]|nr:MAG: hypothetical protein EA384_03485 [Spirochaetaceae bacterium]
MNRIVLVLMSVCALLAAAVPAFAERRTRFGPTILFHRADFAEDAFEQTSSPPAIPDSGAALSIGIGVSHIEPLTESLGLLIALRLTTAIAVAGDREGRSLSDYRTPRAIGDGIVGISAIRGRAGTVRFDAGGGFYFVNLMVRGIDSSVPSLETRLLGGVGIEAAASVPLTAGSDLFAAGCFGYGFFPLTTGIRRTDSVLGSGLTIGVQLWH